jgi:hypothetical protein
MQPYLPKFHRVLAEFDSLGLDAEAIFAWSNCDDPLFRRNRKQMVISMPALAITLASEPSIPIFVELAAMIDRGNSLVDGLCQLTHVRMQSVRYLCGKAVLELCPAWLSSPLELLQAIDLLPREKLPQSVKEWEIIRTFWEGAGLDGDYHYSRRAFLIRERTPIKEHLFLGLCSAGYQRTQAKLGRLWQGNLSQLSDIADYIEFVREWCRAIHPEASEFAEHRMADSLLKRYSAMALIQQSDAWHRRIHEVKVTVSPTVREGGAIQWPQLPGLPWTNNGLSILALTTPEVLQNEGNRLDHCVAAYAHNCILGKSHIVSIRDADDQSLTTAEIFLEISKDKAIHPVVRQHRGANNIAATADCIAVLNAWLSGLAAEPMQKAMHQIINFHNNEQRRIELCSLLQLEPEYSRTTLDQVMEEVLPDYEASLVWLEQQASEIRRQNSANLSSELSVLRASPYG